MGLVDARAHNNGRIYSTIQHTNAAGLANSAARLLPEGTVCFSRTASVGYVVIMGRSMATSQDFVNWVPTEAISSEWLQLVMIAERPAIPRFSKGAVHQTIYYPAWLSMHVALPPLAEQHRIVAKVDELMALCDRLEAARAKRETTRDRLTAASLARLNAPDPDPATLADHARFALDNLTVLTTRPDQIKQLRQTILNLAVRGKLVPQDAEEKAPRVPPRRQFAAASGMDDEVFEQFRDSMALPSGWQIASLAQLSENIVDCPHTTPKWTESGEICIRTNQLRPRALDLSEPRYVSPEAYLERIERLEPKADDILYSREGGILGIACRVPHGIRLCLGQRLMLVRAGAATRADFLEIVLNSPFITDLAKARTTGGAAPRVNMSTVRAYPIPLPPLAEQHRIVAKVDALMSLCDRLEASLTATAATRRRLLDALLAEALEPADIKRDLEAAE
jgi:type I restriction enzyme S subunit